MVIFGTGTTVNSNSWGPEKNVRVIRYFESDDVFRMGKRSDSLGELYELCDNPSYNCSSYAESTVYSSYSHWYWSIQFL